MTKERAFLLVAAALVLGTATGVFRSQQTSKPTPAPVSLRWAPNEPGDGCCIDKPVFWITNHTGKTLNVKIEAIEIRQGAVWVPFSPPATLPPVGQLHYRKQQLGTPKHTGLLGPHQVDYCHVTTHRIVLPTNAVWRVRASVSEILAGTEKMVAAIKYEPVLLAYRLRLGDTNFSVNPKDISYHGPAVDVFSQEVVPPSVAKQLPPELTGATHERVVHSKPQTLRQFSRAMGHARSPSALVRPRSASLHYPIPPSSQIKADQAFADASPSPIFPSFAPSALFG